MIYSLTSRASTLIWFVEKNKKRDSKMQINETADKIQDKFENFLNKYSEILSKPNLNALKKRL